MRDALSSLGTGDGERDNLGGLTVVEGGRADDGGDGVDGKVPYYIPTYVLYRTGLKQKKGFVYVILFSNVGLVRTVVSISHCGCDDPGSIPGLDNVSY